MFFLIPVPQAIMLDVFSIPTFPIMIVFRRKIVNVGIFVYMVWK